MTTVSDMQGTANNNTFQYRKTCQLMHRILDILKDFQDHLDTKFNFSKMIDYLNIPKSELSETVELILGFQELFETGLQGHRVVKRRIDNMIYLEVHEKDKGKMDHLVNISRDDLKLFNDIIYTFKFIKRGKGFNLSKNGTEILTKLKELKRNHPCLFDTSENGLIYPSEVGIKLGEKIISYNKIGKEMEKWNEIDDYVFRVISDE